MHPKTCFHKVCKDGFLTQILHRIYLCTIDTYFKVQMETGREASASDISDCLTLADSLSNGNCHRGHMAIQCGVCAVMLNDDIVAVTAAAATAGALCIVMGAAGDHTNNGAALGSDNCCACISAGNINCPMCCTPTVAVCTGYGIISRARPCKSTAAGRRLCITASVVIAGAIVAAIVGRIAVAIVTVAIGGIVLISGSRCVILGRIIRTGRGI